MTSVGCLVILNHEAHHSARAGRQHPLCLDEPRGNGWLEMLLEMQVGFIVYK